MMALLHIQPAAETKMKHFTADPHFGDERAVNFPERKGHTVDSWAEFVLDLLNTRVNRSDELFILGDFCLKDLAKWRMKIRCNNVWLIKGNHDPSDAACKAVFGEQFRHTYAGKVKDQQCWMSHYPHMAWPSSHHGSFHLHGHLHDQRSQYWDSIWADRRMLDVAPESYLRIHGEFDIWSEDEVYDYMMARKGHDDVEWYRKNRGEL